MVAGIDSPRDRSPFTLPLWIIALSLVLAFCYFASSLCITILLAAFLAIVVDPLIAQLERLRIPRMVSVALVIVAGTVLIGIVIYGSYRQVSDAVDKLPLYARRVGEAVAPITRRIEKVQDAAGKVGAPVAPRRIPEVKVKTDYPDWTTYVIRGVGPVSGAIIIIGAVPFLMFFILIQKHRLKQKLSIIWGDDVDVSAFANSVTGMVRGFIVGNLVIGASMAIVTIGVLLALKVDHAALLGSVSGLLNLVPFLGALAGSVVPMGAALLQGQSVSKLLVIFFAVVLLHTVSANLLIPRIISRRVSLSPVAATVGILFWGWLWGLIGVLLAVPLTALIKIMADSHSTLNKIGNLLAERPRAIPPWSRATEAHRNETRVKDRKIS